MNATTRQEILDLIARLNAVITDLARYVADDDPEARDIRSPVHVR